jgi:hypothetical protein
MGVHVWEKYLTVEEFQELSAARDAVDKSELKLEESFTPALVQVKTQPTLVQPTLISRRPHLLI